MNYENLKKLLPRERELTEDEFIEKGIFFNQDSEIAKGNQIRKQALAEVTASLPLLVEYIYADLRDRLPEEKPAITGEETDLEYLVTCAENGIIRYIKKLLTPNK